jgi:aerobic carbon-monoxide dehydrogenase medium subunit
MSSFELAVPSTADEAVALLRIDRGEGVAALAGGTDLLADLDDGRLVARRVVSLRRLPWRTLDWNGDALTIGSTLPLRRIELDPAVRARVPGLYESVRAVGGPALRHRATIGGNLARAAPASDLIPTLLALDAEVDLLGPDGARRVPVDRFVLGARRTALLPGELIRSVGLPEGRPSAYLWQRVRPSNDISQIAVAVAYAPGERSWRVAVGGVPPRPALVPEAAAALTGPAPSGAEAERAGEAAARHAPIVADKRASEEYRRQLAGTLVRRAVALVARRVRP